MTYRTLALEMDGPVAVLRLTRPERENRIDSDALRELDDACAAVNDAPTVRVLILAAEGDVFCAGWDGVPDRDARRERPFAGLERVAQPVVCALNGDAHSAGLELALACDMRLAAEGARFSLPETGLGGLPMAGGTQRLARLVGRGEALRLLLLGEEIDAEEARRIGLVGAVVPRDDLANEADALARRMASRGPIALRYAKEAVRHGLEQPLDQALRYETDLSVILQTTDDRAEGVRAFMEKREPKFKGS